MLLIIIVIIIGILIISFFRGIQRINSGNFETDASTKEFAQDVIVSTSQSSDFIKTAIKKTQKSFEQRITKSNITGCSWVQTNDESANILYTFRTNNELLITTNGLVKKAEYEIIIDNNSILITKDNITEHYNLVIFKSDFLFLNKISSDYVIILANQTKFKDEIKTNLNKKARQSQNFIIELERKKNDYTIIEETDHMFISVYSNWLNENPNKTIFDFITKMEGKVRFDASGYHNWLEFNRDKSTLDYAEYLVNKKYKS